MGFAFDCSTGLIHACAGVMKSFRSVSVWCCGLIHYIDRTRVYEPTSAPEKAIEGPCVFKPKDICKLNNSELVTNRSHVDAVMSAMYLIINYMNSNKSQQSVQIICVQKSLRRVEIMTKMASLMLERYK